MGTALKRAVKVAAKRSALSFSDDQQVARKELKRLGDRWEKREPSPGKFHKPTNALKGGELRRNANRQHAVFSY